MLALVEALTEMLVLRQSFKTLNFLNPQMDLDYLV